MAYLPWGVDVMIVVLHKKHVTFSALFLVFMAGMAFVLWQGRADVSAFSGQTQKSAARIVVVDPGHGGEDGGAVAGDGTVESGLNLEIAQRLSDLLLFSGQETVMTRDSDVSIYSEGSKTIHEKKVSDLKNRVELVNGLDNAVLLSVHQNTLPGSSRTHGAQVFFNGVTGGDTLAKSMQACLNTAVNAGNEKVAKRIPDTIYLAKNVTAPAVIVECGFLSNTGDTAALKTPRHQILLALAIAAGYLTAEDFE